MLFLNSDFKRSYYTTRLLLLVHCNDFHWVSHKLNLRVSTVKWQTQAVCSWFKCYVCTCAWSYRILAWLEPCAFHDVTISRRVFALCTRTHTRFAGPNCVCSTLMSVLLLNLEKRQESDYGGLHSIDLTAVSATEKKADVSWESLLGRRKCR